MQNVPPIREIAFDTETTGLDLAADRIIELGCVELINHIPTGRTFQAYLNPERQMSVGAFEVHGLSDAFLANQPKFAEIVDRFLEFVGGDPIVAHNAEFDYGFVNAEFLRIGRPQWDRARLVDSLDLAKKRFPMGPNSLDILCGRFGVDTSRRVLHGALLDAQLLAEIYIELLGGRQHSLLLDDTETRLLADLALRGAVVAQRPVVRPLAVSDEELAAHAVLLKSLEGGGLWGRYLVAEAAE